MASILETERLSLSMLTLQDAPFILELLNTPIWLQFIGNRNIQSLAQAQSYLVNGPLMSYAALGYGLWLVSLKGSGKAIGICGLLKRDYLEHVDIGYALLPEYTAQGYATEIVKATLVYSFQTLQLPAISAITKAENGSSINVLKKTGFYFTKTVFNDDGVELLQYVVYRKEASH